MSSPKVAEKTSVISEKKSELAVKGLCSTCIHADECTFPKSEDAPVMFCEEFEIEKAPERRVIRQESEREELPGKKNLKGLCLNCANAATCTYPKPETGVWHCEEYR
ncbi:MAG: hypothetical protein ACLFSQ_11895 [Candidatus Zixiibacteriota bacterium]